MEANRAVEVLKKRRNLLLNLRYWREPHPSRPFTNGEIAERNDMWIELDTITFAIKAIEKRGYAEQIIAELPKLREENNKPLFDKVTRQTMAALEKDNTKLRERERMCGDECAKKELEIVTLREELRKQSHSSQFRRGELQQSIIAKKDETIKELEKADKAMKDTIDWHITESAKKGARIKELEKKPNIYNLLVDGLASGDITLTLVFIAIEESIRRRTEIPAGVRNTMIYLSVCIPIRTCL